MTAPEMRAGVGAELGYIRLNAGMSHEEVSSATSYPAKLIEDIERGVYAPSPTLVRELSVLYAKKIAGAASRPAASESVDITAREIETRPCSVRGCIDGSHRYMDGVKDDLCLAISVADQDGSDASAWYVAGYRDELSGHWSAFSDPPEFAELEGASGLAAIERFATAFRAVQRHCDNLNKLERSTP